VHSPILAKTAFRMSAAGKQSGDPNHWGSFEPYAQLVISQLPRAASVTLFDSQGKLRWSTDPTTGPDLVTLIGETLALAERESDSHGELRILEGGLPIYVCWLRSDAGALIAMVAVACRAADTEARSFALVHALLRPALECLRRDLLARAAIFDLGHRVSSLDKDLELLLADPGATADSAGDDADELKGILQQSNEYLRCVTSALFVPDKGIVLIRSSSGKPPDSQMVTRTYRQLLSMAQIRREPVIINQLAAGTAAGAVPYRILSCPLKHASGRATGVLALFRDQSAEEFVDRDARLGDVLARKAASVIESSFDAMSGLYTRQAFEHRVRAVVTDPKRGTAWSALYIDSDQLHVINDNFGMHVGDGIISQIGELLRGRLPRGAFAARISGDRFAVLLPIGLEDAAQFAESLRAGAEQLGTLRGDARLHVSISIGVAPFEREARELMHSLAAAETACKAAKDRGRNRVAVYEPDDASIVRRFTDINIASRVRAALEADRLRFDAQLILPFGGAEHSRPHYELLLRMIDEDGKTVGPDRFLSAANRYQLMPTIDCWVVQKAIALLKPHAALLAARPCVFAINFSGQSLNDDGFGDFLLEQIESSGLNPAIFCFELTETATVANISRAEVLMRRLRRLGCGVALDDFGTGLSSLSYLRQLPVTLLKIDGSFVRDILKDARAESMVRAIAQLARSMGIGTVAEYVETEEILTRVASLGVDYGQGFAIGQPAPLVDLLADELPVLAAAATVDCTGQQRLPQALVANM
jgi:diguanylate cyclase (GGDEF)-like protein